MDTASLMDTLTHMLAFPLFLTFSRGFTLVFKLYFYILYIPPLSLEARVCWEIANGN